MSIKLNKIIIKKDSSKVSIDYTNFPSLFVEKIKKLSTIPPL